LGSNKEGSVLGEALYWMAEKLTRGYEDVEPDPVEALKLFRQSADLGFSDALIRIGQLQQQGKGNTNSRCAGRSSSKRAPGSPGCVTRPASRTSPTATRALADTQIQARLTNGSRQNIIASIPGSRRQVADIKSESRPASNRNRWPPSYWNAWPASSESVSICRIVVANRPARRLPRGAKGDAHRLEKSAHEHLESRPECSVTTKEGGLKPPQKSVPAGRCQQPRQRVRRLPK
jgi:hypothetical protein